MAGQLKFFLNEWTKITSDPYILQCVSSCPLEFYSEPLFATQSMEFLAFVMDSILIRFAITKVKVDNMLPLCRSFLGNKFIGTLVSTLHGVELGPLHTSGTGQGTSGLSRRFCRVYVSISGKHRGFELVG